MDGKRLLHSLLLRGFLSYGNKGHGLNLQPLNVFIGPNASGKSNFVQAVELLRATPVNLAAPIYGGGGMEEFIYKGPTKSFGVHVMAEVAVDSDDPFWDTSDQEILRHAFSFLSIQNSLYVTRESIVSISLEEEPGVPKTYYKYDGSVPVLYPYQNVTVVENGVELVRRKQVEQKVNRQNFDDSASILSQRKDPDTYPEITDLGRQYQAIKIYRDFTMNGPNSMRAAQRPDLPNDFLEEDGRNLSLILNDLHHRGAMPTVVEKMRAVYEDVEDITVKVGGGVVQTFIRERGMSSPIPAARLSDGTLRYLCLLAILLHPEPPPLVCFEEPEIGMHPDLIATIADMLLEASQRMQIIVTTHSDILVSALSSVPETVIVCERTEDGSRLRRLEREPLEKWLQNYSLGELWRTGEIGGVRY